MGYLNRVIHLDFPDLAGREDPENDNSRSIIWLTVRNPRIIPGEELIGKAAAVRHDADGQVIVDEATARGAYASYARLIVGGCVLDPTVDSDTPPPLPMPPGPDDVAKYPIEILTRIGQLMQDSVPR